MNIQQMDIMNSLRKDKYTNQRTLAENTGHSLGIINRSLNELREERYLDENFILTSKADKLFRKNKPVNAIILAAGLGMRMVPVNTQIPKGLLKIDNETLIERLIRQLQEAGIYNITVVTGFMKEKYEYLIDEYHVKIKVNTEYASKNNLHSINQVREDIGNTYIVPCDLWCRNNPFSKDELYSWYMVKEKENRYSSVRVNRKQELVAVSYDSVGNEAVGICYITKEDAPQIIENIKNLSGLFRYDGSFWEEALFDGKRMIPAARVVGDDQVIEINTYLQLKEIVNHTGHLNDGLFEILNRVLGVRRHDIKKIVSLKKGTTNNSFLLITDNKKYVVRIPENNTLPVLDRQIEKAVYDEIKESEISDQVLYFDPVSGCRITSYLEDFRTCNIKEKKDLEACMTALRNLHGRHFRVDRNFSLFETIQYYEELRGDEESVYKDYRNTKENVFSLRPLIEEGMGEKCLVHMDPSAENFLFGKEGQIRLIDWELAAMYDPHIDIAMFVVNSMFDKEQADDLIDMYFKGQCTNKIRKKIYAYIAGCGLMWSNWCEVKFQEGIEFGEYSIKQYRYAKEFYRLVKEIGV